MKRIVLIFGLLLPLTIEAQVGRFPYQTIRQTYQGDTLETTIGDTVKHYTNADAYSYNKQLVIRDTSLLELIKSHGGGSSSYIGDNFLSLPGDGEGNNYLDLQVGRDGGYIDYWWTSTDETQSISLNVTPSRFHYYVDQDGTGTYSMDFYVSNLQYTALFSIETPYGRVSLMSGLSGSLTDGAPTAAEISTVVGVAATGVSSGCQVTIKDTDGSGLLYKVESDGSNWFYTVMSQAL